MATGEVILSGTPIGSGGTFGTSLANLFDGNDQTTFTAYPLNQASMGIDAGATCTLTRVRLSPAGGSEDRGIIGGLLQGNSVNVFSGFAFVQGQINAILASGFVTCTFSSPNSSGHCIVAFLMCDGTFTSMTDLAGNTYGSPLTSQSNGAGFTLYAFVAQNTLTYAPRNTLTANITGGTYASLMVAEYAGIPTSNAVDVFASAFGASGTTSTVSCTTTNASDVVLCATAAPSVSTIMAGTGYNLKISYALGHQSGSGNSNSGLEDNYVTVAGIQTATTTFTPSGAWATIIIALQATAGTPTTLYTIPNRAASGTLFNEYALSSPPPFRYYRFLSPSNSYGDLADLDFLTTYTAGVTAQCCTPTIIPPGGDYDEPIVVRFSCITTDALFYYTLDGTTPTAGSVLYTGPIVVSSSCTLNVIGVSANVSNSRVASTVFHVPSAFISTDQIMDNRNYPLGPSCVSPSIFYDPIGKWWWMYGWNLDEPTVMMHGFVGQNYYKSPDTRNWTYVGTDFNPEYHDDGTTNSNYRYRSGVLYNVLNNNYVWWMGGTTVTDIWTAPAPSGPFTKVATYSTILGLQQEGDIALFLDPADGVTAYLIKEVGSSDSRTIIARLTTDYINVDGVNFVNYPNSVSGPFGQKSEGYSMFYNNGHYFWMASGYTVWQPNLNLCVSNTAGPLGTWGSPFNPFANVAVTQTAIEAAVSVTPTYLIAYDSQNCHPLQIPGRNAFIYLGDRYDTGLSNPTFSSNTANFYGYRRLTLPMTFPTASTLSITWNNNWSLDSSFPTVSGAPAAASGLSVTGSVATWVNNETGGYALYLDSALATDFASVTSEVLPVGTTAFTMTAQSGPYYRVRTVNANGTSVSNTYPPPPPPPPPPGPPSSPSGLRIADPSNDILMESIIQETKDGIIHNAITPGVQAVENHLSKHEILKYFRQIDYQYRV